jgi:hypothetical protein
MPISSKAPKELDVDFVERYEFPESQRVVRKRLHHENLGTPIHPETAQDVCGWRCPATTHPQDDDGFWFH